MYDLKREDKMEKEKEFDSLSDLMDAVMVEYGDVKFSIDYASRNRNKWKFLEKLQEIKKTNPSIKFILKVK